MRDDWGELDRDDRPRGRLRLVALATIPWLLVAFLAVRTVDRGARATDVDTDLATDLGTGPGTEPDGSRPAAGPSPSPVPAPLRGPANDLVALRFGPRSVPGPDDAGAVATLVARAWLSGVGPSLHLETSPAGRPLYVEHLVVEAVDVPTPQAAVVTVLGVVLTADDGTYTGADVVRLGVPVTLDRAGAHPAGRPWWLPAPDLSLRTPDWSPIDDPDALADAGAALTAAGYADVEVDSLAGTPGDAGWPILAGATAVAPGAVEREEHTVWLRDDHGRLVVAGLLAPEPSP